ncbi:hypothetical protein C1646_727766 [Rhizophagus diaphanus]|nr:hypothetical protein C1646_727766 [Rhizophagus diaphanus] [Rhizophagus sp. MUCL 43196]
MMEEFLVNWKDRHAFTIFTVVDPTCRGEDFTELINKHKSNGVVKDYKYDSIFELEDKNLKYYL